MEMIPKDDSKVFVDAGPAERGTNRVIVAGDSIDCDENHGKVRICLFAGG
jgi:hypothetical protein